MIPKTASTANPLDLTYSLNSAENFFNIPDILLEEKNADMLLAYLLSPGMFMERILKEMGVPEETIPAERDKMITDHAKAFLSLVDRHPDKLIVGFTYRSLQEGMVRYLLDRGIPIYQDPERAARAMAAVLHYYKMRDKVGKRKASTV